MPAEQTERPRPSDRTELWRDRLSGAFAGLMPEPIGPVGATAENQGGAGPSGELSGLWLGGLASFEVTGSPQVVRRSQATVRRQPTDLLKVCLQVRGRTTIHQDDREIVVERGQMALYDTARPYELKLQQAWSCAVLAFPRKALALPGGLLSRFMDRAHSTDSGPGAVLAGFVAATVAQAHSLPPGASERLGDAGLSLLAGVVQSQASPSPDEAADGARVQVMSFVRRNLLQRNLSHASVAAEHGMSERTLSRLFEREEYSVSAYIRHLRLEAARRDLADPALSNRSIAAIAARWNFVDPTQFSRMFRAAYQVSPSHARLPMDDPTTFHKHLA